MKRITPARAILALLHLSALLALSQGAGIEWDILNQEAQTLYQEGNYDRAVVVAKKSLEVAEKNAGPDHADVAFSLEKLAGLYRAIDRKKEAGKLEQRVARIRAIER